MKKADLHCHSKFSEHPSEWFLQRLGARESYTDPLDIYAMAKKAGMDYVTITDHNRIEGALKLKEKYPNDTFTGLEATTYFPEDNCKIHILIYDISDLQFEIINHLRKDIYELRNYLKEEQIIHSVAHASYSVNGKLKLSHIERLILLFDHFETHNGGRSKWGNQGWRRVLDNLNDAHIGDLYTRYRIEPYSDNPWIKGFTGGSDDHGALFIGKTYTQTKAESVAGFLKNIREKNSIPQGRYSDFQSLAFTIYKIAYDFSISIGNSKQGNSIINTVAATLFEDRKPPLKQRLKLHGLKGYTERQGDEISRRFGELASILRQSKGMDIDDKLNEVYHQISNIADAFCRILINSFEDDIRHLNIIKILHNISSSIPGVFLMLPFFSSLKHMNSDVDIVTDMNNAFCVNVEQRKRRTLWFTDTLTDLNGVSATLKQLCKVAIEHDWDMKVVCSFRDSEISSNLPQNLMNLDNMYTFSLPYYDSYQVKIPSVLKSMRSIEEYDPDLIIVSTPGPIGLLGLLYSKLSNTKCIGIYHTDFSGQVRHIVNDDSAENLILAYEKWFYNQMNEMRVPTNEYRSIISEKGIVNPKVGVFKRGIETEVFRPLQDDKVFLRKWQCCTGGITLLYSGRVSADKSLDVLVSAYKILVKKFPALNLVVAGSGPYLSAMQDSLKGYSRAVFTGSMNRYELVEVYNAADYFIFPSVTDTFGMVILEALACGLPSIVSDKGGPKEVIIPGHTGFVVKDQTIDAWVNAIWSAISFMASNPEQYKQMRAECRESVQSKGNWEEVLEDILGSRMIV